MRHALLLSVALAACSAPTEPSIAEETPEAIGVLALLNGGEASYRVLDDDVGLDRRAARAIIAYRYGLDGTLGTADDGWFHTIAEVEVLPGVDDQVLERLLWIARARGLV